MKAVQRVLRRFSVSKMQNESKKICNARSFSEISIKTIVNNEAFGHLWRGGSAL
jgi:hypothetical protein